MDLGTYLEHPQEDIQKMLHHEMAHVILNDAVSGKMVPRWFHEGLAQSVTSEGHQTVQKAFAYWKWSDGRLSEVGLCDLNGAIDEFAHGPDNGYCYPEYYLAVQRFRQLGGPKALLLAIDDINAGRSFNEILPAVTGLDAATFQADVERYANEIFNNRRPIP